MYKKKSKKEKKRKKENKIIWNKNYAIWKSQDMQSFEPEVLTGTNARVTLSTDEFKLQPIYLRFIYAKFLSYVKPMEKL